MKYEVLDIETVAVLLGGVSERQIRNYVAQGMPSQKEGRTRTFNWYEVLEWYVGYKSALEAGDRPRAGDDEFDEDEGDVEGPADRRENLQQATLRKTRAEANLKELALSRLRGEVVTIADAKTRLDRLMGNLRSRLLGMAPKLASRTEGLKRTEREAAIKEELEAVCREISTGAVIELQDETNPPAAETKPPDSETTVSLTAAAELRSNLETLRAAAELLEEYDDAAVQ